MAAEWQLRAYRVDLARLMALVGCKDPKLLAAVTKRAKKARLDNDPRIEDKLEISKILGELIGGQLDRGHRAGYRIALEVVADATALPLASAFTTYAARDELGTILTKLGLPSLGRGWDRSAVAWPWTSKPPKMVWPSASYWTAAQLASSAKELAAAVKKGSLDERVRRLSKDTFFADDNVEAIRMIGQVLRAARNPLPANRPRCVAGTTDGLLVLLDGER